jgi:hypothetical protein
MWTVIKINDLRIDLGYPYLSWVVLLTSSGHALTFAGVGVGGNDFE